MNSSVGFAKVLQTAPFCRTLFHLCFQHQFGAREGKRENFIDVPVPEGNAKPCPEVRKGHQGACCYLHIFALQV